MYRDSDSTFSFISWTSDHDLFLEPKDTDSGQETDEFELVENDEKTSPWDAASSCSTKVPPSAFEFEYTHGRRYHGYKRGTYPLPNDMLEQQREDTLHAMLLELTQGKLFYSDVGDYPQKIIDIGTGTGNWVIDVADRFPSASVVGTDLSPIQPTWLPVNARMFVEDCEEADWLHGSHYDLIHLRSLSGVLRNLDHVVKKASAHLERGGYVEIQDFGTQILCDDGTMDDNDAVKLFHEASMEGMRALGCKPTEPTDMAEALRKAGLVDIQCVIRKIPISSWPRDRNMRIIGMFMKAAMLDSLEAFAAKPFEALNIPTEERKSLVTQVRHALEDRRSHRYINYCFCFGRKA